MYISRGPTPCTIILSDPIHPAAGTFAINRLNNLRSSVNVHVEDMRLLIPLRELTGLVNPDASIPHSRHVLILCDLVYPNAHRRAKPPRVGPVAPDERRCRRGLA